MGIQQKYLTILFRSIQPELLYDQMRGRGLDRARLSAANIPGDVFQRLAPSAFQGYSHEELENILSLIGEKMSTLPHGVETRPCVFNLLVWMGKRALRLDAASIRYDFSEALAWRTVYQELGQDIFTTAFLAYEDLRHGAADRDMFTWEAIIKSDNFRLNSILDQGMAENHCHLGGTTQNFPISWACLMNYPKMIVRVSRTFKANLHPTVNRGFGDNVWPWDRRLMWAAYLRMRLFMSLEGIKSEKGMDMEDLFSPWTALKSGVSALRAQYGLPIWVKGSPPFVLDYALRRRDCQDGLADSHFRLLSGERSFLYRCFTACFDGTFDDELQSWFYMYLLLKENFRAEIVQVNMQPGFYNFKQYQDRKDFIYDSFPGYNAEALRLSINASQSSQHIPSFEARLGPKHSTKEMVRQIRNNEKYVQDAGGLRPDFALFYVYHFIKSPEEPYDGPIHPRDFKLREKVRLQAGAIAGLMRSSQQMCDKVLGIDAANIEIRCRPEVFAVAYRYLSDLAFSHVPDAFLNQSTAPHLHRTYHAGEDFLDIADGLRAIDEAIFFLGLKRGDRLGHALALGVDPVEHYRFKTSRIVLCKQDLLDNLVWLLFRSQEIGANLDTQLGNRLHTRAKALFAEIYGPFTRDSGYTNDLQDYYYSMQLRGDLPELYMTLPYSRVNSFRTGGYESYSENPVKKIESYRKDPAISTLYQVYHYDRAVRTAGRMVQEFHIDEAYIRLMREMQDKMSGYISQKGLMIECNPTSNYLIGTFRRYDRHPIFRFNNAELLRADGTPLKSPQISVSINTDDLGVFDTSLENEYAILAAALERAADENGEMIYTATSIYKYLDNVRRMGLEQSFRLREHMHKFGLTEKVIKM